MATIVVTGGAGFIGSHVAKGYMSQGHQVVVIDDLSSGKEGLIPKGADFHLMDIRNSGLASLLKRLKPDIVNHHAAQISVPQSVRDPKLDSSINVAGTINVLEAAIQSGASRFIFSSTGGALYGEPHYLPCDEKHPINPLSPYGVSKFCAERYILYYAQTSNITPVILRYSNVYGPDQNPHGEAGVVAIFSQRILTRQECFIDGDGEQARDFVYVRDIVNANIAALERGGNGTYNIGTGIGKTVKELHKLLTIAAGSEASHPTYRDPRVGDVYQISLDCARATEELLWKPQFSFDAGLEETVAAFASKG